MRQLLGKKGAAPASGRTRGQQDVSPAGRLYLGGLLQPFKLRSGGRLVTLSVENDTARIVVFKRRQILAWWTAQLGASSQLPEKDGKREFAEHAPSSLPLLKDLPLPGGRVVTDLPPLTPLMRRLHLPKMGQRYLEQVVVSELLDSIPFSREEVDIAWRMWGNGSGREVFAVAVAKEATDGHVRLLREAGVQLVAAYAQASALALVAGAPDAVVVHLGLAQASLVLVRDNVPQTVHQVDLPSAERSPEDLAESLARGVQLLAGFRQPADLKEGSEALPLVLTGQVGSNGPVTEALTRSLGWEVLAFKPPFSYPQGFDPAQYAVNLGLALADSARARGLGQPRQAKIPSLNLLPTRHLPRPLPLGRLAILFAFLLLGAASLGVKGQVNRVASEAAALSVQWDTVERQARQQRISSMRASTVEKKTRATAQLSSGLESHVESWQGEMRTLLLRLDTLRGSALPPNVRLSSIALQGETFVLTGTGPTYEGVIQYASNLRETGVFTEVKIAKMDMLDASGSPGSVQAAGGRSVNFLTRAYVAPPAGTKK